MTNDLTVPISGEFYSETVKSFTFPNSTSHNRGGCRTVAIRICYVEKLYNFHWIFHTDNDIK